LFGLGESFISGEWDSDKLDQALTEIILTQNEHLPRFNLNFVKYLVLERALNLQRGARAYEVGRRHYDLGNDLFSAMLDDSLSYTCGIWTEGGDLNQAQATKLDRLCQRLKLEPGMHVLDIGCGFGNFARYAAQKYGVSVTGLTISQEQAKLARERCNGLPVEILIQDYAESSGGVFSGTFDRVVSIEMIEAVGRKNFSGFFEFVYRSLRPGGRFALQAISGESFRTGSSPALDQFLVWLVKHIFPNGYLPSNRELMVPLDRGFVLEDMQNFGGDYDRTLQAWLANFEVAWPNLAPKYGEQFRRMWRYYLCGCMACFRSKLVQLYQITYVRK
jgi:cyclopropane-fatty-acyl-phospholipid synthase